LELLREVIDLMQVNPRAAATMLGQQTGEDSSAALDFILANLDFQNGHLDAAVERYEKALAKFPDFRRAHKNLGLLRVQRGEFKPAVEHLGRAVELGDRDGRNYGLLGYSYINLERHLAAEQAYRNAILQQPETRDWKLGLARALLAMEKYKEAVALFKGLIEERPDAAAAWILQANAYLGLEEPLAAAVNLEAVRMLGKAQTSSLVLLGDIYMNAGMPDFAKSAYLEVIETDAAGAQFTTAYRAADLLTRSRAFGEAGDILQSIEARYQKLPQDDELKLLTLKAKVARAQGRKREAAKLLESIVERDGTRGDALLELAAYYHEQGNTPKALLLVERAQNLEAFEYQALLDHAQFMVAERDYRRAAELLRGALRLRDEPRVERFLARVEQAIRR
ncbi:MAG: tetratricopeptide repeat protein, partial [Proteobacteria bacterium]|nr:tetratricopeptide repeat protein [Pseudomonadota bacterium]